MTTTQQAPVEILTADDLKTLNAAKEFRTRLEEAADKTPFTCTPERLAAAAIAIAGLCEIIERVGLSALRQPQAARLTEEERKTLEWVRVGEWVPRIRSALKIIDRLTAAPAQQVTTTDIASCICVRPSDEPGCIDTASVFESADAVMSLLASRGLVREG